MNAWQNLELDVETRVSVLMAEMTLPEKIGQTHQIVSAGQEHADLIREGCIGTTIYASGPFAGNVRDDGVSVRALNEVQRIAVEESRLGIPLLFARDIIHGHKTVFPIPLGQAASWSREWVEKAARITSIEARADGIHWNFAPMLDISRDARWGRVAETFGEDPFLTSVLGCSAVKGYEGEDLSKEDAMASCAKTFIGYSAVEAGRDHGVVDIGKRVLLDTYMPPFKAVVEAGTASLMGSYAEIEGIPIAAHRELVRDVLKGDWGFDGVFITDWKSINELMTHGVAGDARSASCMAMKAGMDIDMISDAYLTHLQDLIESGELEESLLDDAVRRILTLKFKLGLFDRPYTEEGRRSQVMLQAEHRQCARKLASESIVLLENNGILPLRKNLDLLITGPMVEADSVLFGTWTLDGDAEDVVTIKQALEETGSDFKELRLKAFSDEAVLYSRLSDVSLVFLGEHPMRGGEANSTVSLELPPGQLDLLRALKRVGTPIVAVVVAGRPLDLSEVRELADAVVFTYHPGIEGGHAIVDVLTGAQNPCGRLPMTMPRHTGQAPIYYNHKPGNREMPKDDRKKSKYVDSPTAPLYPFGYGLSYTRFDYSKLELSQPSMDVKGELTVSVDVKNVGDRRGTEVVQLYVRDQVAQVTRPIRELKGFTRVDLDAGESARVNLTLQARELAYTGHSMRRIIEPGRHRLWIAPHAQGGLSAEFEVTGETLEID